MCGAWDNQFAAAGRKVSILDCAETRALAPAVGPRVSDAPFCALEGHTNPLPARAGAGAGGEGAGHAAPAGPLRQGPASAGRYGHSLEFADGGSAAFERVVLAARLGFSELAGGLGKSFPLRPQREQMLATRRVAPNLDLPTTHVRQAAEGSVLLGDSKEDVGMNYGTSLPAARAIAERAIASFPALADAPVVRTWGALRVMSPDGFPIYQSWPDLPGLHAAACHSGVTLAAAHAEVLAPAIAGGGLPAEAAAFNAERFDVQEARAS